MTAMIWGRADWSALAERRSGKADLTALSLRQHRTSQRAISPLEWMSAMADNADMDHIPKPSSGQIRTFLRGIGVRQVRLVCGLVLFTYLISHFLNHALGNISLDALADGVYYHTLFWQFIPVAIIFYGSALIHSCLGFWALYQRRQFSWVALEPLQLVLGFSIPALVAFHVIGARLGHSLFDQEKLYPQELYAFWVSNPFKGVQI